MPSIPNWYQLIAGPSAPRPGQPAPAAFVLPLSSVAPNPAAAARPAAHTLPRPIGALLLDTLPAIALTPGQPQPIRAPVADALDAAAALGATLLIAPWPDAPERPDDAERVALDLFRAVRFDAERRAVRVAWQLPPASLHSVQFVRALFDAANSPWVGAALDSRAHAPIATWIEILTHRVAAVATTATPDSAEFAAVAAALAQQRCDAPIIVLPVPR
ncbi:MAG: hypothetical protein U1A27_04840 [Phycisphaerae bacterium]